MQAGLLALGVVALLAKLVLLTSATHAGFLACYRSPLAAPPAGACERSYENPFSRFGVTRIDRVLDFAPRTWNLSFVNSLRFSFYDWVPGNVRRDRLPLAATWITTVERPRPWTAEIGYVGVVALQVDSMEPTRLAARYDARAVAHVPVPAGRHRLTVDYAFDDASRVGDGRVLGPYATLRLARVHEATGRSALVRSLRPAGAWRWTGTAVDVVAILFAATLAVTCALVVNRDAWVPAVVAAAAASYLWAGHRPSVPADTWLFLVLVPLLGHLALAPRPRRLLGAYFGILAAALFLVTGRLDRLHLVEYRRAGDDWLTYESFARSILETWSLRGAEDVFYYQPLFRYVLFAEHLVLGDGHPLVSTSAIVALTWSLFWMCAMASRRRRAPARTLILLLPSLLLLLLATSRTVLGMVHQGMSEYPTWIALPLFLPLLFLSSSPRAWQLGAALLGLSLLGEAEPPAGRAGDPRALPVAGLPDPTARRHGSRAPVRGHRAPSHAAQRLLWWPTRAAHDQRRHFGEPHAPARSAARPRPRRRGSGPAAVPDRAGPVCRRGSRRLDRRARVAADVGGRRRGLGADRARGPAPGAAREPPDLLPRTPPPVRGGLLSAPLHRRVLRDRGGRPPDGRLVGQRRPARRSGEGTGPATRSAAERMASR